jgi:ferrous iron transport protein B
MELPSFKTPDAMNVARNVYQRGEIFMRRAGGIILTLSVIVWLLSTFPGAPQGATRPAIDYSFAGMIGHALEPLFAPIGFNWQMVVALIPGMAAREVAVAALGTVYAVSAEGDAAPLGALLSQQWSLATALSFLAWYIFAPQCTATLAVVKRETNSLRWPIIMFVYMVSLAYLASFATYHTAVALGAG